MVCPSVSTQHTLHVRVVVIDISHRFFILSDRSSALDPHSSHSSLGRKPHKQSLWAYQTN